MKKSVLYWSILLTVTMLTMTLVAQPSRECLETSSVLCEHNCRLDDFGRSKSCIKDIFTPSQSWCLVTGFSPSWCEGGTGGDEWNCHCGFGGGF